MTCSEHSNDHDDSVMFISYLNSGVDVCSLTMPSGGPSHTETVATLLLQPFDHQLGKFNKADANKTYENVNLKLHLVCPTIKLKSWT